VKNPEEAVAGLEAAIEAHDLRGLEAAYQDLASLPKERLAEGSAWIGPQLAEVLGRMPAWHAGVYAVLVGAMVEWNADAAACAPPILSGLERSLTRATEFVRLWRERFGDEQDMPNPQDMPDGKVQERLGPDYSTVWDGPYFGWHTLGMWERASVAVLADPSVRRALPNRAGLLDLAERLEPEYGDLQCVVRALLLLDDEPLLVIDRASGAAFRLRMSGIADNYQLHTLLTGVLVGGGHLPGQAPSPEAVANSSTAVLDLHRLEDLPHFTECFNFAEPSGRWIWGATTPSRIPVVGGIRQLVLDPPIFRHSFRALRFLPRVTASLELEAVLDPAEAAPYLAGIRPLMSRDEAGRLAADGY
jgi:hypothetical protein